MSLPYPATVGQAGAPPPPYNALYMAPPVQMPVAQPVGGVWAYLAHGSVIQLLSCASGKTLRILDNGTIDGNGGGGMYARFIVERPPASPDVIVLKSLHNQINVLGIHDRRLMALPAGSPQGQMRVHVHPDQKISLESVTSPGQHIGVLPSGQVKPPHQTGRGMHGQFSVKLPPSQAVGPPPVAAEPKTTLTPFVHSAFRPGNRLRLVSKATGGSLRIKGDCTIDGRGGQGPFAKFTAEYRRENVYVLRNVHNPALCLCIRDGALTVGNGCSFCELRIDPAAEGYVTLESVAFPGQHVGILPNGTTKPPGNTRRGPHGQFLVVVG